MYKIYACFPSKEYQIELPYPPFIGLEILAIDGDDLEGVIDFIRFDNLTKRTLVTIK
jgi:hypothetical protein